VSPLSTRTKGSEGEEIARKYLKEKGYRILDLNFQTRTGEIDIIAMDRDIVVFIEVKTSTGRTFGDPLAWVPTWKQRRIVRVSRIYLLRNRLHDAQARYDVVTVDPARRVCHVEDAFRPADEFLM
jgi:putative endonuclease